MNGLELLLRNEAATVLLEAVRISGMVMVAPLGWTQAPARVKAALVVLLTLVAHGDFGQIPVSEGPVEGLAFCVASELVLGVAIGIVPRLILAAVEMAGEEVSVQMGLGAAQIFDPAAHTSQNVITTMLRNLAVLLGVLVGLHRVVIGAVIGSFQAIPAGALHTTRNLTELIVVLSTDAMSTGVKLAIPLIAVLLVTQVALAFISRAAPAIQVFSIGFAITIALGAAILIITMPDFGYDVVAEMSRVSERIEKLILAVKEP
jgi:flagellar biosynthetic protein FliR